MVELESPPMPTCTSQKRSRDHNKLSYFCHLRCFFFCGLSTSLGSYAHICMHVSTYRLQPRNRSCQGHPSMPCSKRGVFGLTDPGGEVCMVLEHVQMDSTNLAFCFSPHIIVGSVVQWRCFVGTLGLVVTDLLNG